MPEFEENTCLIYQDFEDIQLELQPFPHRKNSFIDLLSSSHRVPEDCLLDLQIDTLFNKWELPELNTQPSESEPPELNLDAFLDIQCIRKNKETVIKVANFSQFEKISNSLIGTLTPEQRKAKVKKYQEKRKKRTWQKKIYYDCRKRVADNRLRIKGRFVTRSQAIHILGPDHEAIKHLL